MTKRILNADKPIVEPVKKEPKKVEPKKHWYRVAICQYSDRSLGTYTCVIDKKRYEYSVETNPNFVRWEPAVEVEV